MTVEPLRDELAVRVIGHAKLPPFMTADCFPMAARLLSNVRVVVGSRHDDPGTHLASYRYDALRPSSRRPIGSRIREPRPHGYRHGISEPITEAGDTHPAGEATSGAQTSQPGSHHTYDDEGSERCSHGSVSLGPGLWWTGTLTVPATSANDVMFLQIKRLGHSPIGYGGDESVDLSFPVAEVDDVFALVLGLIAQARRDGVLPSLHTDELTVIGDASPSD